MLSSFLNNPLTTEPGSSESVTGVVSNLEALLPPFFLSGKQQLHVAYDFGVVDLELLHLVLQKMLKQLHEAFVLGPVSTDVVDRLSDGGHPLADVISVVERSHRVHVCLANGDET